MTKKIEVNILRAFVNSENKFGNPVGIILDENKKLNTSERQDLATKLNFSESVFIDTTDFNKISLFNPIREVKFAGHALIGTSYFVNKILGKNVEFIDCKGGHVKTWQEKDLTWIEASLEGTPPWFHRELKNADEVEAIALKVTSAFEHTMVWAWVDRKKRIIRARTFAPDWGIPEDQANGSGSMQLANIVRKKVEIRHGVGSVIYAESLGKNLAKIGGRVAFDKPKTISL